MRCDACGKFRSDLKPVTAAIHYSMGPLMQMLCESCRDDERDAGLKFRTNHTPETETP